MLIPIERLIDGCMQTLREEVLPEVASRAVRGRVWAVLDVLGNLRDRVEERLAPATAEAESAHAAQRLAAARRAGGDAEGAAARERVARGAERAPGGARRGAARGAGRRDRRARTGPERAECEALRAHLAAQALRDVMLLKPSLLSRSRRADACSRTTIFRCTRRPEPVAHPATSDRISTTAISSTALPGMGRCSSAWRWPVSEPARDGRPSAWWDGRQPRSTSRLRRSNAARRASARSRSRCSSRCARCGCRRRRIRADWPASSFRARTAGDRRAARDAARRHAGRDGCDAPHAVRALGGALEIDRRRLAIAPSACSACATARGASARWRARRRAGSAAAVLLAVGAVSFSTTPAPIWASSRTRPAAPGTRAAEAAGLRRAARVPDAADPREERWRGSRTRSPGSRERGARGARASSWCRTRARARCSRSSRWRPSRCSVSATCIPSGGTDSGRAPRPSAPDVAAGPSWRRSIRATSTCSSCAARAGANARHGVLEQLVIGPHLPSGFGRCSTEPFSSWERSPGSCSPAC